MAAKLGAVMISATDLKNATAAVDNAWRRWKEYPNSETEAAYDRAYENWKKFGSRRSVGRPPSGDDSGLTSTERAREARARQQQSATRWEKVAPLIQRMRRAVEVGDSAEVSRIAVALVKETEMVLRNVNVVHAQPDGEFVVLHGWHDRQMVLAFIATEHLDDYFRSREHLSGKKANLVVDRNLDAFARIMSAKYERGEYRPYSRFGSTLPSVDITLEDIAASGETLADSVLDLEPMWVSPDGRKSPA
jgi:hypothetical protein